MALPKLQKTSSPEPLPPYEYDSDDDEDVLADLMYQTPGEPKNVYHLRLDLGKAIRTEPIYARKRGEKPPVRKKDESDEEYRRRVNEPTYMDSLPASVLANIVYNKVKYGVTYPEGVEKVLRCLKIELR